MAHTKKRQFCVCVFCGIPASGKSTLCRQLTALLNDRFLHRQVLSERVKCVSCIHINYDEIQRKQSSDSLTESGAWKLQRKQVLNIVEYIIKHLQNVKPSCLTEMVCPKDIDNDIWSHFLMSPCLDQITESSKKNGNVLMLIDDNMYFHSMRYDYFQLAKTYETGFCEVMMNTSKDSAIQRNLHRLQSQRVDPEVIMKMASRIEPPDASHHPWEKFNLTIDTERESKMDEIWTMIENSFADPAKPTPCNHEEQSESRRIASASIIHQADLILRKCVADAIRERRKDQQLCSQQEIKLFGSIKEKLLKLLKQGDMLQPEFMKEAELKDISKDQDSPFFRYIDDLFKSFLRQAQATK